MSQTDWNTKRLSKELTVSASQIDTFRLCPRKWWLSRVRRLPGNPGAQHFIFGTVLAAVLERYLLADDLGYDECGVPVDIYPPGWTQAFNQFTKELDGEINPAEADIIKRLVAKAIEEGILERRPGRKPEHEFKFTLVELACATCRGSGWVYGRCQCDLNAPRETCSFCDGTGWYPCPDPCPHCEGGRGTSVTIMGALDVLYPESVEDHKSTKAMKWAKSPKKLAKNTQMLVYAKVALEEAKKQGRPLPDNIVLRHNVFCKDPTTLKVKKTETTVTRAQIEAHWDTVIQDAQLMEHWRKTANTWSDLPDPITGSQACNAYGGCEYQTICAGRESEKGYEDRLDRHVQAEKNTSIVPLTISSTPHGEYEMSTFAQTLAAVAGQAPGIAPPPPGAVNNPAAPAAPVAPVAAAPVAPVAAAPVAPVAAAPVAPVAAAPVAPVAAGAGAVSAAPWANPTCIPCAGSGINSKGGACTPCGVFASQVGQPQPHEFILSHPGDGNVRWDHKTTANYGGLTPLQSAGVVEATATVAQPVAAVAVTPPQTTTPVVAEKAPPKTNGRPPKSFELHVNCVISRGGAKSGNRKVIDLAQVLLNYGNEMATSLGQPSFNGIEVTQRRGIIVNGAEALCEGFGNSKVVATNITAEMTDLRVLLEAIMPYAGMEIWGVVPQ